VASQATPMDIAFQPARSLASWLRRAVASAALVGVGVAANAAPQIDKLRAPPGFRVELLTDAVPNARQMTLGRSGDGKGTIRLWDADLAMPLRAMRRSTCSSAAAQASRRLPAAAGSSPEMRKARRLSES